MRVWGSDNEWEHDASVVGVEDEGGAHRPGLFRRIWGRLTRNGCPAGGFPSVGLRASGGDSFADGDQDATSGFPAGAFESAQDPRGAQWPSQFMQPGGGPFTETRLTREVRRLVASLGKVRSDVASALGNAGVRAVPRGRGPVACYLEAVIGADPNVKSVVVGTDSVVVDLRAWWRPTVVVKLPGVVADFTAAFDAGCYPGLMSNGWSAGQVDRAGVPESGPPE